MARRLYEMGADGLSAEGLVVEALVVAFGFGGIEAQRVGVDGDGRSRR